MAPTLAYVDGFEFQLLSATAFAAGGIAPLYTTITTATIDTTTVRSGAASLRCDPTVSVAGTVRRAVPAGNRTIVTSVYVRMASLPGGSTALILLNIATAGIGASIRYDPVTGKFAVYHSGKVADLGMAPVVVDRWYLLDLKFDCSADPFAVAGRVDGDAASEASGTITSTATDITQARLGTVTTTGPACTMYFDDWIYGYTLADYPYGHHAVELLKPTSDGTHNAGTNVVEDQAGADIGAVTAYNLVDEVPPENTDYIKQSAAGSGNYAEVVFATPTGTPWGASYYAAIEGAAANVSDMLMRVVNSSGTTLLDQGGVGAVNGTGRRYSVGYVGGNPTGNKGRMGFASDVSPVPRAVTFVAQAVRPTGVEDVDAAGALVPV